MAKPVALAELSSVVRGELTLGADQLGRFARDASGLVGEPWARVAPKHPEDLQNLIQWAVRQKIPLVARGGGTSLDGESVPIGGAIVVDFAGWNRIVEFDESDGWVRVQPGVINRELHQWLGERGWTFPPNPGSWGESTIGGNVATNASGPRSFRYGPTRHWVLQLEGVLGRGDRFAFGNLSRKRSTGPSLLDLFVGSEGTLGLFSAVTLRVIRRPSRRLGLVASLPASVPLSGIAQRLTHEPALGLSCVEYLDAECARLLRQEEGSRLPGPGSLLLLEVESETASEEDEKLRRVSGVLSRLGIAESPSVFPDADRLWTLRGRSSLAIDREFPLRIREDVGVPLRNLDTLATELKRIADEEKVRFQLYGHLGEGSLHPNYSVDPTSERAERLRSAVVVASRRLGGTISSEHGIGRLKSKYLVSEVGNDGIELLRAMKRVLDPAGILNPGKLLP